MTKRQTRLFFVAGTTLFALVFVALTIDSHRQFGRLTHEEALTDQVVAGKHVWHRKDCINCHTLLGEGAYYAPDLTKITQLRGEAYLRQFLKDPSRFYSEEKHGRLMPNPNLSDQEIGDVIAFLAWVSNIDNNNWPPRPILVSAATPQDAAFGAPVSRLVRRSDCARARRSSGSHPRRASAATRRSRAYRSSVRRWRDWPAVRPKP